MTKPSIKLYSFKPDEECRFLLYIDNVVDPDDIETLFYQYERKLKGFEVSEKGFIKVLKRRGIVFEKFPKKE
jgi:hypothetical protein